MKCYWEYESISHYATYRIKWQYFLLKDAVKNFQFLWFGGFHKHSSIRQPYSGHFQITSYPAQLSVQICVEMHDMIHDWCGLSGIYFIYLWLKVCVIFQYVAFGREGIQTRALILRFTMANEWMKIGTILFILKFPLAISIFQIITSSISEPIKRIVVKTKFSNIISDN